MTFIQRSGSYAGSPYDDGDGLLGAPDGAIQQIAEDRLLWGGGYAALESVEGIESAAWKICEDDTDEDSRFIIPGDIIVNYGVIGGIDWEHCSVVYKIDKINIDRKIDDANVYTVEAAGINMRMENYRTFFKQSNINGLDFISVRRLKSY